MRAGGRRGERERAREGGGRRGERETDREERGREGGGRRDAKIKNEICITIDPGVYRMLRDLSRWQKQ